MNKQIKPLHLALIVLSTLILLPTTARAQGTAFTYQGQLAGGGAPANGSFDLSFTMFNATSNGVVIAGPITNNATVVTNGLFTTTIDFGGGVFTGSNYWLQVAVRTNGNGAFTMVSPLQPILPTPYAVYSPNAGNAATAITATTATSAVTAGIAGSANSVSAANIVGTIQVMQLPVGVILNNQNSVTLGGRFSGNGSGLTNVAKLSSNQTFTCVNIFNNNVGLGISTPFRNFQVRPAVNSILGIFENTGLGGMTIESVNDANSANQSLEFRGSPSVFTVGNVGIGKTNPAAALDVNGTVTATFFSGNGSGLTNVNLTGPSASSTLGNEALGYQALVANTTGYYNSANGANALSANLTGFKNTATGQAALQNNTSGWQNTATGQGALRNNTTGANNTASGQCALQLNTTGNNNTANGLNSLSHNTIGVNNTAYGFATL